MSEIILGTIILAILGIFGWYIREQNRERSRLINAILAKNPQEYKDLNITDKLDLKPTVEAPPEFIVSSELDESEFDEHIKKTLEN